MSWRPVTGVCEPGVPAPLASAGLTPMVTPPVGFTEATVRPYSPRLGLTVPLVLLQPVATRMVPAAKMNVLHNFFILVTPWTLLFLHDQRDVELLHNIG